MQTFDAGNLSAGEFNKILSFLRAGGVIGFPTDTAYGLGADPFCERAVERIFAIKGRPESNPILVLVDSLQTLQQVADWNAALPLAGVLAERFWPGPLTLVLPAVDRVPHQLTAGTRTVGVRWPRAPFALRLIEALGTPITATSANKSGMPGTSTAQQVEQQLGHDLEMLVDGGTLSTPQGSTILNLTVSPPVVIREGPIARASLDAVLNGSTR